MISIRETYAVNVCISTVDRARDRVELNARINQFVLVSEHAARYAQHIANNCLAYTRGVRVFDN